MILDQRIPQGLEVDPQITSVLLAEKPEQFNSLGQFEHDLLTVLSLQLTNAHSARLLSVKESELPGLRSNLLQDMGATSPEHLTYMGLYHEVTKFRRLDAADLGLKHITAAERKMAGLGALGFNRPAIAELLNISESTVNVHNTNLYGALGVHNKKGSIWRMFQVGYWLTKSQIEMRSQG